MDSPHPSTFAGPPGFGPASSGPNRNAFEEILVSIHEVERLAGGRAAPGGYLLGVKVAVTSQREKPILKVEPRRFVILMAGGATTRGRFCTVKEPAIANRYLRRGETVAGWIAFDVPMGAKDLAFISELTQPPARLSLPVPDESEE
jgi:hypothetical protein